MIPTTIQLTALILTLESAIFLSKGNLGLSAKVVARLAATKWDKNLDVVKSLAEQNADNWIGVVLLLTSFLLQMIIALSLGQAASLAIDAPSLILSIIVSAVIFLISWQVSRFKAKRLAAQAEEILSSKGS